MHASYVKTKHVTLAIEDSGKAGSGSGSGSGKGSPILLLHGLGATLRDWSCVMPHITAHHRVIALDLRNHGLSGNGAWQWSSVLDDIAQVLATLGAETAIIVGHSLGGIIATMYACLHRETPGVINVDGFGFGEPEDYLGLDPNVVRKRLSRMRVIETAHAGASISESDLASMLQNATRVATQLGIPSDVLTSRVWRRLKRHTDGLLLHHPDKAQLLEVYDSLEGVDIFALSASLPCPGVIVRATRAMQEDRHIGSWTEVRDAYAESLKRQLANLSAPNLSVHYVDATHDLLFETPAVVAEIINEFHASLQR